MESDASANVELVERFSGAFNRRDLESLLALCHAEIELDSPAGTFRGLDGARQWATKQWEGNTPVEVAIDRLEVSDDGRVVHHGRLLFRWAETGELAQEAAIRAEFTIADGTVVRWTGGPAEDSQP
jgi:limonene-1,2-epoxide hydrolase